MKALTKASFIEKASDFYDKRQIEMDDKQQDFYAYEEKLDDLITQFGQELLQVGLGSVPEDIRKKKVQTRFGKIEIAQKHAYSEAVNGYRISPYLQERIVLSNITELLKI